MHLINPRVCGMGGGVGRARQSRGRVVCPGLGGSIEEDGGRGVERERGGGGVKKCALSLCCAALSLPNVWRKAARASGQRLGGQLFSGSSSVAWTVCV